MANKTIATILSLSAQGYSAEQIENMLHVSTLASPTPNPAPQAQQMEAEPYRPLFPTYPPVPAPAPQAPQAPQASNDALLAAINNLTHAVQGMNIRGEYTPTPATPQEAADNVLASIINPPKQEV